MTNIAIIGLGLMGASFAKKLTRLNYNVYGIDVSQQTIGKAKELKIIVDGSTNPLDVISKCDTFIFCLYPTKILPWIEHPNGSWINKEGAPTKQSIVQKWRLEHPEGKKADCIRDTGLTKPTVYKWWNI